MCLEGSDHDIGVIEVLLYRQREPRTVGQNTCVSTEILTQNDSTMFSDFTACYLLSCSPACGNSRRFETLCLFHLHIHSPMKMEQTQCPETSVIEHHTPGNNPKDNTQHLERGESLKSRITRMYTDIYW
jgi:hypothetical protein